MKKGVPSSGSISEALYSASRSWSREYSKLPQMKAPLRAFIVPPPSVKKRYPVLCSPSCARLNEPFSISYPSPTWL